MTNKDKTLWDKTKTFLIRGKKSLKNPSFEQWKKDSERGLNAIFSTESRPQVHRVFAFLTLFLVIAFALPIIFSLIQNATGPSKGPHSTAQSLDFSLDPSYKIDELIQHLERLKQADPFKTEHNGPSSNIDELKICEDASRQSSLPLNLDSTIVMQDAFKSLAAIQHKSKNKITAYRVSEKIDSQARVDKIERLRVIFRNLQNGQCEYIANSSFDPKKQSVRVMDPTAAQNFIHSQEKIDGIKNDGNNFQISKSFMKSKIGDMSKILTEAKAIPLNNPDGTMSFRIEEVEAGGLFSYLNINSGDVITKINGQPISSMNEIYTLMNQLTNLSAVNITVMRNGTENSMQYNFVDQ